MKTKKYRIVRDNYAGYEVQQWRIFWPFWVQLTGCGVGINTFSSVERAIDFINSRKSTGTVVWKDY